MPVTGGDRERLEEFVDTTFEKIDEFSMDHANLKHLETVEALLISLAEFAGSSIDQYPWVHGNLAHHIHKAYTCCPNLLKETADTYLASDPQHIELSQLQRTIVSLRLIENSFEHESKVRLFCSTQITNMSSIAQEAVDKMMRRVVSESRDCTSALTTMVQQSRPVEVLWFHGMTAKSTFDDVGERAKTSIDMLSDDDLEATMKASQQA